MAVLCAAAWSANCHAIEPVPDNVVLITLDTTRADRLPAYGFQGVSTPALDRLAAEGIVFEDAVAQVPLTLPSHASMLTGRWPAKHGIRDNADAALAPAELTLAEVLAERGVRTSAFVASVVLQSGRGLEQGFDTYVDVPKGLCGPGTLQRQRRPGDAVVDDALAWIDHNAERPFFTWVHLYDAHRPGPYVPDAQTTRSGDPYLDTIAFQDSQIARIVAALESRRLLDKTIVVVAADHGESLGEHGEDGHGIFLYESTLRVPLIMRVPDFRPRRVTSTVRLVDLMPTLLDLLHVPVTTADGVSLARLMRPDGTDIQLEAYSESTYPERFGWSRLRSLRGDRYKLIDAPRPELVRSPNRSVRATQSLRGESTARRPHAGADQTVRGAGARATPLQRRRGRGPCQPPGGPGLCRHSTPARSARAEESWPDPKDTIQE